jgi:hypothetical protein
MPILKLLRGKNNSTLTVITTHRRSDVFNNKYDCTYILNSDELSEVTKELYVDEECVFAEFDDLLMQDDVTYQINVLPTLSLIIRTKEEEYTISSNTLYTTDIFVNDQSKSIINSPSKIFTKIIRREVIPVKIIVKYENIKDTVTIRSYSEHSPYLDNPVTITNPVPLITKEPVQKELFKPKGYTNVIVGNEVELDPDKHRNKIIAEVMQHVENVANGEVHAAEPNKTLEDVRIHDDNKVTQAEVEAYRKKVFSGGLQELAKEARRKEEQSTEDDFSI